MPAKSSFHFSNFERPLLLASRVEIEGRPREGDEK
jgi:hypothetical protein